MIPPSFHLRPGANGFGPFIRVFIAEHSPRAATFHCRLPDRQLSILASAPDFLFCLCSFSNASVDRSQRMLVKGVDVRGVGAVRGRRRHFAADRARGAVLGRAPGPLRGARGRDHVRPRPGDRHFLSVMAKN